MKFHYGKSNDKHKNIQTIFMGKLKINELYFTHTGQQGKLKLHKMKSNCF